MNNLSILDYLNEIKDIMANNYKFSNEKFLKLKNDIMEIDDVILVKAKIIGLKNLKNEGLFKKYNFDSNL